MINSEDVRQEAWSEIAQILGVSIEDRDALRPVALAVATWESCEKQCEKQGDAQLFNGKSKDKLERIVRLSAELSDALNDIKDHMFLRSHTLKHVDFDVMFSQFEHVASVASDYSSNIRLRRGPGGDTSRFLAFNMAANIFEACTGRNVARSSNKFDDPSGPFIRYMLAFCRIARPTEDHNPESIVQFVRRRQKLKRDGRNPIAVALGLQED